MAPLAWLMLLFALLGHTVFAIPSDSPLKVPDIGRGLSFETSPFNAPNDVNDTLTSDSLFLAPRDDEKPDPTDLGWIKRWAALGDSFTAGIGAGDLYRHGNKDDIKCSRYDRSYPSRLEKAFGEDAHFQYLACSGDRTEQIYQQARDMEKDNDLVILTAGGNDLCLSDIIKRCVLMPFQSEEKCNDAIDRADQNLDQILTENARDVLKELDFKVRKGGLVLWVLYAEFFNADHDKCGMDQDWTLGRIGKALPLTRERRRKFNDLVARTNKVLRNVVEDTIKNGQMRYRLRIVDWNEFPISGVRGQFCYPGTKGFYPDHGQPDLQFFKTNTALIQETPPYTGEGKRDVMVNSADDMLMYNSLIYKSPSPAAQAEHRLDPRAPKPPHCPGDREKEDEGWLEEWLKDAIESIGFGLPDNIGKLFHPNELGHATIASFALQEIYNARAEELGVFNPLCKNFDKFECKKKDDEWSNYYADCDQAVQAKENFCARGRTKDDEADKKLPWHKKTYNEDTPDEMVFEIQMNQTDADKPFDTDECNDSFNRIIHGCDGLDPENPMNFKYGGRWVRGSNTYTLTMGGERIKRIKEVPKKPVGRCMLKVYPDFDTRYKVQGSGWASWDRGLWTLMPEIRLCTRRRGPLTYFRFTYFDAPNSYGMEWQAEFTIHARFPPDCSMVPSNAAGEEIPCERYTVFDDTSDWENGRDDGGSYGGNDGGNGEHGDL